MKTNLILMVLLTLFFINCSNSHTLDGELFVGVWEVRDESFSIIDGKQTNIFIENYILELNSDNCGIRYDLNQDTTNTIKWAFQEWSDEDAILISTSLNSSESFPLYSNELFAITKLKPDEIKMTRNNANNQNEMEIYTVNTLTLKSK